MTIKMNWGKRIAILYLGFVAVIITLVVSSMHQDFDLVAKDYYAQEIAYQNTIDAGKNQSLLSAAVTVDISGSELVVTFPREFNNKLLKADLHFYSPVKEAFDKKLSLNTATGRLSIARTALLKTNYRLRLSWECEGHKYFQETELNLSVK